MIAPAKDPTAPSDGATHRSNPEHCLTIEGLHVHYGDVCALDSISFSLSCGHLLGLVGPNGAGKSTLLKAIAGLIPKPAGSIIWQGEPVSAEVRHRQFAYLPQREEVDWNFPITVRGVVEMGRYPFLGVWGRFRKRDRYAVQNAIETLDLGDLAKRQISELSGGQQQRVFLARALAGEAHVLLLDEPFNGLDRDSAARLLTHLQSLAASGRLIIASSHDLATVRDAFTHALVLRTRPITFGPAAKTLTPETIAAAFA